MSRPPQPLDVQFSDIRSSIALLLPGGVAVVPQPDGTLTIRWQGSHGWIEMAIGLPQQAVAAGQPLWRGLPVRLSGSDRDAAIRRERAAAMVRGLSRAIPGEGMAWLRPRTEPVAPGLWLPEPMLGGATFWGCWSLDPDTRTHDGGTIFLRNADGRQRSLQLGGPASGPRFLALPPVADRADDGLAAILAFILARSFATVLHDVPPADVAPAPTDQDRPDGGGDAPSTPFSEPSAASDGGNARQTRSLLAACNGNQTLDFDTSRFFSYWGKGTEALDQFAIGVFLEELPPLVLQASRECMLPIGLLTGLADNIMGFRYGTHRLQPAFERVAVTDFTDRELVFGSDATMAEAVGSVTGRPVHVVQACHYRMIGADLDLASSTGLFEPGCLSVKEKTVGGLESDAPRSWCADYLGFAREREAPPASRAVALVGFGHHTEPGVRELVGLLGGFGVQVACCLVPGASPGWREAFRGVGTVVMPPWAPVVDNLRPNYLEKGYAVCAPDAPIGPGGTRRWCGEVCAAVGAPPPGDRDWDRLWGRHAAAWDRLAVRAAGFTVGLVADIGGAREMAQPGFFFGIDLPAFLREAGFELVLIENADDNPSPSMAGAVVADMRDPGWLAGQAALHRLDLVYCDTPSADSIWNSGAAPFCLHDLEFGLEGSLRSLRRLVMRAGSGVRRMVAPDIGPGLVRP